MKLGFVIPIVVPTVSGAPGLSTCCRDVEDLGYDTLWVGDRLVTPVDVDSSYLAHGPQMTRSLDPVLLWTIAAATCRMRQHAQHVLLRATAPGPAADHARRAQRRPPWRWSGGWGG